MPNHFSSMVFVAEIELAGSVDLPFWWSNLSNLEYLDSKNPEAEIFAICITVKFMILKAIACGTRIAVIFKSLRECFCVVLLGQAMPRLRGFSPQRLFL